ncbi:MAG: AAA family ATPase [Alphaproteobacteria bacterium]|nr:AAA family ATPase [Alphaproteobacteria bacterium]
MAHDVTHDRAPAGLEQPKPLATAGSERQSGRIIVFSNLKGGTGKSTTALSVIVGLLRRGKSVASLDLDMDQEALSRYLFNRKRFAKLTKLRIGMPDHHRFTEIDPGGNGAELSTRLDTLSGLIDNLVAENDYLVIDCPSLDNPLTRAVTARADVLTSPVNESFLDIDVIGEVRGSPPTVTRVGPFAEIIGAEMQRRRDEGIDQLEWIVVRNRRNPTATRHTAAIGTVLGELSRNLSFRVTDGFVDRLIFRELFLVGLSILDLRKDDPLIASNSSHRSAYEEASNLLQSVGRTLFADGASAERLSGENRPALVDAKLVRRRRVKPADGLEAPPHLETFRPEAQSGTATNGKYEAAAEARSRETEVLAQPAANGSVDAAPGTNGSSDVPTDLAAGQEEITGDAAPDASIGAAAETSSADLAQDASGLAETPPTDVREDTPPVFSDEPTSTAAIIAPDTYTPPATPATEPRIGARSKILVVYDAAGGRRHRLNFRATLSRLARLGCVVSVHECHGPMDGKAFFRDTNIAEYDAILVAGSDSSLMALAGPLATSGLPVAIASPHSSRHLAGELGLSLAPKSIADNVVDGLAQEWFLAEANNCPFVSFATVGLAADLSFGPRQRRAALAAAQETPSEDGYRIVVDGRYRDVAGAFLVNAQFLPRDFASIEGAVRGEPKLYAVMLERGGWRDRLRFRSALMAGRLPRARGVVVEPAEQISIWGAAGEAIIVEGEAICTLPAQLRIMRNPITILS